VSLRMLCGRNPNEASARYNIWQAWSVGGLCTFQQPNREALTQRAVPRRTEPASRRRRCMRGSSR
jgi:hypothetical protein